MSTTLLQNFCCTRPDATPAFANLDRISKRRFTILKCRTCQTGWTDVSNDFDVSPYYPKEYYGKKNIRFNRFVEFFIHLFRKRRARAINIFFGSRPGRILDIGCGRALMLQELKQQGWKCYGIEYSKISSEYARDISGVLIKIALDLPSCKFPEKHFDVVSLWHVFEHLKNPTEVLKEIKKILKPEGVLLMEVPNFSSWQSRMNGGKWIYLEAPRHLYHFSKKGLVQFLDRAGFQKQKISTFSFEFGFLGMIQSLLNLLLPEPNFLFALLKNKEGKILDLSRWDFYKNLCVLALLIVPCCLTGVILEGLAVLLGRGGVVKVVCRK